MLNLCLTVYYLSEILIGPKRLHLVIKVQKTNPGCSLSASHSPDKNLDHSPDLNELSNNIHRSSSLWFYRVKSIMILKRMWLDIDCNLAPLCAMV